MADRVLITGIAGGLARLIGAELDELGYEVIGVDYRKCPPLEFDAEVYRARYNKTKIEDIIRRHEPTHVLHLGRVGNLKESLERRFELNVMGSRKLMELALRYQVKRLVVLSTFHIYGAHPHNHIPIAEDEPLRAGTEFPEIADAIQLDNQAVMWCYQHRKLSTAVLRPTNVVGPNIRNAMSRFLRQPRIPVIMGYDPMVQFVFETDLCEAVVGMMESDAVGVFNVAGPQPIAWKKALGVLDATLIPIPSTAAWAWLKLAGFVVPTLPPYLVNFFKYPCVIDDTRIREALDWEPSVEPEDAVWETVEG